MISGWQVRQRCTQGSSAKPIATCLTTPSTVTNSTNSCQLRTGASKLRVWAKEVSRIAASRSFERRVEVGPTAMSRAARWRRLQCNAEGCSSQRRAVGCSDQRGPGGSRLRHPRVRQPVVRWSWRAYREPSNLETLPFAKGALLRTRHLTQTICQIFRLDE